MKSTTKVRGSTQGRLDSIRDEIIVQLITTSSKKPIKTTELLDIGSYEEVMTVLTELKLKNEVNHCILHKPGEQVDGLWWQSGVINKVKKEEFVRGYGKH